MLAALVTIIVGGVFKHNHRKGGSWMLLAGCLTLPFSMIMKGSYDNVDVAWFAGLDFFSVYSAELTDSEYQEMISERKREMRDPNGPSIYDIERERNAANARIHAYS